MGCKWYLQGCWYKVFANPYQVLHLRECAYRSDDKILSCFSIAVLHHLYQWKYKAVEYHFLPVFFSTLHCVQIHFYMVRTKLPKHVTNSLEQHTAKVITIFNFKKIKE